MKVALLQIQFDPTSRAGNIQRLVRALDRAAGSEFAPDLVVLPGGCDSGGRHRMRARDHAGVVSVRETLAWKAREWGVYVAAGVHEEHGADWVPCAVLFDPDGDYVAGSATGGGRTEQHAGGTLAIWSSSVGEIAVVEPTTADVATRTDHPAAGGIVIAVPVADDLVSGESAQPVPLRSAAVDSLSTGGDVFWACACGAAPSDESGSAIPTTSRLVGQDGGIIAEAEGAGEAFVFAEIPVSPAPGGP